VRAWYKECRLGSSTGRIRSGQIEIAARSQLKISLSFNVLALVLALGSIAPTAAQMPALDDSRHSMLREAMLGVLPSGSQAVSVDAVRGQCQPLPNPPVGEGIEGPHGDSLLSTKCKVVDYASIPAVGGSTWALAQYQWTSVFTAEDATRGPLARDTAIEKEVVLFEGIENGWLRPIWHARFEDGPYAIWRSVTPSLAPSSNGGVLLSVQSCVNGTGGCAQEFLHRRRGGAWRPIWQTWYDELPQGAAGRILHGTQIDPRTLRGVAGYYGPRDPNCCPSQRLEVQLQLQGDHLALKNWQVKPEDQR
jgi:hypothetical protein